MRAWIAGSFVLLYDTFLVKTMSYKKLPGLRLILLLCLIMPLETILAAETTLLRIEQRKESEGFPRVTTIGAFGIGIGNGKMAHMDISYMENERDAVSGAKPGNAWGFELGVGYLIPTQVTLFIGGGFLLAMQKGDFIKTYFPEAGILFQVSDGVALTASKKRYMKLHGDTEDVIAFGLALSYN